MRGDHVKPCRTRGCRKLVSQVSKGRACACDVTRPIARASRGSAAAGQRISR